MSENNWELGRPALVRARRSPSQFPDRGWNSNLHHTYPTFFLNFHSELSILDPWDKVIFVPAASIQEIGTSLTRRPTLMRWMLRSMSKQ